MRGPPSSCHCEPHSSPVIASTILPLSLRAPRSGAKQSLSSDSPFSFVRVPGTRDCHVGTKNVPPRNDVRGEATTLDTVIARPTTPLSLRACEAGVAISVLGSQRFCHCEGHGSGPWQSPENKPQYSPKASLRGSFYEPKQSLFWGSKVPEIATSPKMRAPRNDVVGKTTLLGAVIASLRSRRGNLSFGSSPCALGTGDCFVGAKDAPPRNDVLGDGRGSQVAEIVASCRWHSSQ